MRLVKLFIACSLDGYIAREDGGIDWLFTDQDYGYTSFYAGVDTLVMGRKTYDLARSFSEYPYAGKTVYVFSRSRAGARDEHASFINDPPGDVVARLKQEPGRDVWLVGGGELVRAFLDHDLIDRFEIFIHPVLLGSGIPLFPRGAVRTALRLEGVTEFRSGLVRLAYTRPQPIFS